MGRILTKYFDLIRKFIPDKKEECAVGIDIGGTSCKLIELVKEGEQFSVVRWAVEPICNGNAADAVKKLMANWVVPCTNPYTAAAGRGTLIRHMSMPRMSLQDLKNSFEIEADKYFPFAQDQIYTDCCILDEQDKGKNMMVMAAAAKKELIDDRIKLLKSLDYRVELIGTNPIALANTIHVLGGEEHNSATGIAVLDLGEAVSTLTITVDKKPYFTRDILIGGKDITKRISNALGINFSEAEKLKRNPESNEVKVDNACESAILNIIQELKLSFDYFTTEFDIETRKLMLTGGGSMQCGIGDVFAKNLEIDVCHWNPFENMQVGEGIDKKELNLHAPLLCVALGLALYHYD